MSAPKRAVPTRKGRYYTDPKNAKARYPSVTNVIDTSLNKPALVGWAARTVAEEALNSLPKLVKMARTERQAAVTWLKGQPYAKKDEAAHLGSAAHDIAEQVILGTRSRDEADDLEEPLRSMVMQFLAFLVDWRPEYEATEATVVNRTVGYAGTLDALVRLPDLGDRLLVLDYKTGATGPYPEWALQLAAYANAEALWLPDGTEIPMPTVAGALILRVRPEFYALHEMPSGPEVFETFRSMAAVAQWVHAQDDKTCGDPLVPSTVAAEVA